MKKQNFYINILLYLFFTFFSNLSHAQCQPTYSGAKCVGTPIQFTGSTTGTTHDWDFNGESSLSGQRLVKYAFKTSGTKTVTCVKF